jgi:hypothetical protein
VAGGKAMKKIEKFIYILSGQLLFVLWLFSPFPEQITSLISMFIIIIAVLTFIEGSPNVQR